MSELQITGTVRKCQVGGFTMIGRPGQPVDAYVADRFVAADIVDAMNSLTALRTANAELVRQRDALRGACELALEFLVECNPQDPELDYSDAERCPAGHKNECGACEARRTIEAALAAQPTPGTQGGNDASVSIHR